MSPAVEKFLTCTKNHEVEQKGVHKWNVVLNVQSGVWCPYHTELSAECGEGGMDVGPLRSVISREISLGVHHLPSQAESKSFLKVLKKNPACIKTGLLLP